MTTRRQRPHPPTPTLSELERELSAVLKAVAPWLRGGRLLLPKTNRERQRLRRHWQRVGDLLALTEAMRNLQTASLYLSEREVSRRFWRSRDGNAVKRRRSERVKNGYIREGRRLDDEGYAGSRRQLALFLSQHPPVGTARRRARQITAYLAEAGLPPKKM
jgi:hypothetical protein